MVHRKECNLGLYALLVESNHYNGPATSYSIEGCNLRTMALIKLQQHESIDCLPPSLTASAPRSQPFPISILYLQVPLTLLHIFPIWFAFWGACSGLGSIVACWAFNLRLSHSPLHSGLSRRSSDMVTIRTNPPTDKRHETTQNDYDGNFLIISDTIEITSRVISGSIGRLITSLTAFSDSGSVSKTILLPPKTFIL